MQLEGESWRNLETQTGQEFYGNSQAGLGHFDPVPYHKPTVVQFVQGYYRQNQNDKNNKEHLTLL